MSEMQKVTVEFKDQDCLVSALEEMGYSPEVHATAIDMIGYGGVKRKANVIVSKNQFGGMANAGFQKMEDGTYTLHVDDYDWGSHGKRFNLNKIKQNYTKATIKKYVNNTSKYVLVNETEEKGNIKMRIRIQEF